MTILRNEDLRVDVYSTSEGCFAVYRHTKLGSRFQCQLKDMSRGALEFVWETMKSITLDPSLAAKISPEAAQIIVTARSLNSDQLTAWAGGVDRDLIMISIFELMRRGEPAPEVALYGNPDAMNDRMIRTYLLTNFRESGLRDG